MKTLLTLSALLAATTASAHDAGVHLHPHGSETPLMVIAASLIILAGIVAARR